MGMYATKIKLTIEDLRTSNSADRYVINSDRKAMSTCNGMCKG